LKGGKKKANFFVLFAQERGKFRGSRKGGGIRRVAVPRPGSRIRTGWVAITRPEGEATHRSGPDEKKENPAGAQTPHQERRPERHEKKNRKKPANRSKKT